MLGDESIATIESTSPAKSRVQFGATQFAKVNPCIHAYARAKGNYLATAVGLLQNFIDQVWTFEEQATAPGEITMMPAAQHADLDHWDVLDMRQYRCPTSDRVWFSCEDQSLWFMPGECDSLSLCGEWRAYQDEGCGVWWCNESSGHLVFPAAA